MMFGYNHVCRAGHTYKAWVFNGPRPPCPICAELIHEAALKVERLRRTASYYKPSYSTKPPAVPLSRRESVSAMDRRDFRSSTRVEPSSDPIRSYTFPESGPDRIYTPTSETIISGGGGDFGGGGASGSWGNDTPSSTCGSTDSGSSDSSSSCSSGD